MFKRWSSLFQVPHLYNTQWPPEPRFGPQQQSPPSLFMASVHQCHEVAPLHGGPICSDLLGPKQKQATWGDPPEGLEISASRPQYSLNFKHLLDIFIFFPPAIFRIFRFSRVQASSLLLQPPLRYRQTCGSKHQDLQKKTETLFPTSRDPRRAPSLLERPNQAPHWIMDPQKKRWVPQGIPGDPTLEGKVNNGGILLTKSHVGM